MERAGVPVVPGETPADQSDASIAAAARRAGFPLLIKASAGGGGKGMRIVRDEAGLAAAISGARHEAKAAFGDDTLYVERLVAKPRHVEIQVFADAHGGAVHLFERDCSAQRRHQKVIEESPSPCADAGAARAHGRRRRRGSPGGRLSQRGHGRVPARGRGRRTPASTSWR